MLIGELAKRTGTTTKTLRFYEDAGLLPEPPRTPNGYRDYPDQMADRIGFIHAAQAAGFGLRDIWQILGISDSGNRPCEHVGRLIDQRLAEVEQRIAELQRTRRVLTELAERTARLDPTECAGYCDVIQPSTR
ncbi:heavy metal-responsive transcriptional regulator [Phytoactinopolyspora mesophila]|uniref:MerR family DNA-binding transcriptional regulator n=1 Tax=Phytoactinopolyspora mesophila TaxID=2650750 RepID=A0A7K3M825_9ACTN|nr:heavy metal-responsive transcriptional regulator [Phytoactinopolyspora mesophila]NDL59481.1 MerR family DNA-binding transcriptional regulator [Phytoactinopolyspora mesophila]